MYRDIDRFCLLVSDGVLCCPICERGLFSVDGQVWPGARVERRGGQVMCGDCALAVDVGADFVRVGAKM